MSNILHYGIDFSVKPINIFNVLNQQIGQVTMSTEKMTSRFETAWKRLLAANQALEGLRSLSTALEEASQPGIALNTSLTDLSAITGITGKALDNISEAARASAIAFGTDAPQNVESYKLLVSQLSPEIAKNAIALKEMGNHVNILSKTMGGDTVAATEVLTTAMNQYGVSLDNPMQASKTMADMMNVMAAAAKEGSAELPQIKSALEQTGMVAKACGVTFSETNAAIQVLDKAGKKGAEGGVAIRNALSTLSEGRFLPKQTKAELEAAGVSIAQLGDKSIPLSSRLNALKPIINDTALITKLFGKENAAAAIALVNGSEAIDDYNSKIQGTNTAVDQAKIVMGSYQEGIKRVTAYVNDFGISLFNAIEGALPYIQSLFIGLTGLGQVATEVNSIITFVKAFRKDTSEATKATNNLTSSVKRNTIQTRLFAIWQGIASVSSRIFAKAIKGVRNAFFWATGAVRTFSIAVASIPVIGWIAIAVTAITAAVMYLWDNCRKFREVVYGIWEVCKLVFRKIAAVVTGLWTNTIKPIFSSTGSFVSGVFTWIGDKANAVWTSMITGIQTAWLSISNFFTGLWQGFKNMFSGFVNFIDAWIIQPISGAFSGLWTTISKFFKQIWTGIKELFEPIMELWQKLVPEDAFAGLKRIWGKFKLTYGEGADKGGASFDNSKKEEAGETAADATSLIPKLQTGKGGLKGFGTAAADAAKNTPSATDKLSSLSNNNQGGGNRSLTINKLVETLIVKVERLPESKERIKDAVAEALLTAVNDYNLAT